MNLENLKKIISNEYFIAGLLHNLSIWPTETIYHIDHTYRALEKEAERLSGNGILFDLVFQFYPWRTYIEHSFSKGILPLWNPYTMAGLPFLANDQSSVFEITKLLSYIFGISAKSFLLFSGFIILWLAGFFTYLFCRNLKISKTGSLIAGLAFMFSGPIIVWLGYPLTNVVIWLPFILFCIDKLIFSSEKFLWVGLLSLGIAFQFFAGNPEPSWFILFTASLYTVFRLFLFKIKEKTSFKKISKNAFYILLALFLGFLIASIQLIPTLEFLYQSKALEMGRGGARSLGFLGAIKAGEWLGWHTMQDIKESLRHLIFLIWPDYFGNPARGGYWGPGNYNEAALFVGLIPLFFAFLSFISIFKKRRKPEIIFWLFITIFSFGSVLLLPIFRLVAYLPIFSFTAIGRLRYICVFALAILAGYGFDVLINRNKDKKSDKNLKPWKKLFLFNVFYIIVALIIFLITRFWMHLSPSPPDLMMLTLEILLLLVILIVFNFSFAFIFSSRGLRKLGFLLLLVLVAGELMLYTFDYHPAIPYKFVYPQTPTVEFLKKNINNYRFTSYKESLDRFRSALLPNSGMIWGLQDVRGYEIIQVRRYEAFLKEFGGLDNRFVYKSFNPKVFDILGVKYFVQGKDDIERRIIRRKDFLDFVYGDKFVEIYENKNVMPRAFVSFNLKEVKDVQEAINEFFKDNFNPRKLTLVETSKQLNFQNAPENKVQEAQILGYKPNLVEIKIETNNNGYLVLTDTFYPGWKAYIDGEETKIYPTDIAFRGIFVPKGKHDIVFRYKPESFYYSVYISIVTLVVSLLLISASFIKRIKFFGK